MSNRKISRRQFLQSLSAGVGIVLADQLLVGCGGSNQLPAQTQNEPGAPPEVTSIPTSTRQSQSWPTTITTESIPETEIPPPTSSPISIPSDLVVARNGDPEEMVRRAIAALGGMERFVPKGAKVVVKPNICTAYHTYEYAATTNPWVVGAVVKLCIEAGASRVQVMDYPFGGTPDQAYAKSGIPEQVIAAGGEMVVMPRFKYKEVDVPQGKSLKKISVCEDVLNADVLIDVPIAKHHGSARLTLGMKNLMGLVLDRQSIHLDLHQRIADLNTRLRPALTIVDAVRILMNHGPTGGDLNDVKKMDMVIASPDIIAADSYATTLFDLQPTDIPYITAGQALGLGQSDLKNLQIEEITVGA